MDNFTQLEKYLYLYRLYQKDDLTLGKEKEYVLGFVNLLIENKIIATRLFKNTLDILTF